MEAFDQADEEGFLDLPQELVTYIASFSHTPRDLFNLARTCKALEYLIDNMFVWNRMFQRGFEQKMPFVDAQERRIANLYLHAYGSKLAYRKLLMHKVRWQKAFKDNDGKHLSESEYTLVGRNMSGPAIVLRGVVAADVTPSVEDSSFAGEESEVLQEAGGLVPKTYIAVAARLRDIHERSITVREADTGRLVHEFKAENSGTDPVEWNPFRLGASYPFLGVGLENGICEVYDLRTGDLVMTTCPPKGDACVLMVLFADVDDTPLVFDEDTDSPFASAGRPVDAGRQPSASHQHLFPIVARSVVVGYVDGTVCRFPLESGRHVLPMWRVTLVNRLYFMAVDSGLLWVTCRRGMVDLYDFETGRHLRTHALADPEQDLTRIDATNGHALIATTEGKTLHAVLEDGHNLRVIKEHGMDSDKHMLGACRFLDTFASIGLVNSQVVSVFILSCQTLECIASLETRVQPGRHGNSCSLYYNGDYVALLTDWVSMFHADNPGNEAYCLSLPQEP